MEPNPAAIFCPVNFNDIPELFRIGRDTSCDSIRVVYRPNDIDSFIALLRAAGYEACIAGDSSCPNSAACGWSSASSRRSGPGRHRLQ